MNNSFTNEEVLEAWEEETDLEIRDVIMDEMEKRGLFPADSQLEYENRTGVYPDVRDPMFLQKLLARREFAESKQSTWIPASDTGGTQDFEITPVQRFCANLMSPRTPYQSALLYHGVGVGKTCAAVQIAENWLSIYPRKKVIIVAPRNIKAGFEKTIFNMDRVRLPPEDDTTTPNSAALCTGSTYLELTNMLYERNPKKVQAKAEEAIRRRYVIFGYLAFANYIENLLKPALKAKTAERRLQMEAQIIRQNFSGRLVIIDETHNLKELPDALSGGPLEDEDLTGPGGEGDQKDSAAGKKLTPFIDKVLSYAEGMKLVLMSATPMYNSYREIIFLLNLLLKNDKQATIREQDIFLANGEFREGGERRLGHIAQRYISFMRGENPLTFPIRLFPRDASKAGIAPYPTKSPRNGFVNLDESIYVENLPIVPTTLSGDTLAAVRELSGQLPQGDGGISSIQLDKIIQAGNLVVPNPPGEEYSYKQRTEVTAMSLHFQTSTSGGEMQWFPRYDGAADWLREDRIADHAPKYKSVLEHLRTAEGVCFVYTRFVNIGAVPFALMLEANGFTPYGRRSGLLGTGAITPGGRICSRCGQREANHGGRGHEFNAAKYVLLTGDENISPKNAESIAAEGGEKNAGGDVIKVVIGSQVASEGVDLKYIREIHVIDPWFHLNKTEQILGRGIRFRSHMALPKEKRNTTIYLHVGVRPVDDNMESGDLYSYRVAFRKGQQMGRVNRVLKQYAIDCNLNHDAILIKDADPVEQIDSRGVRREAVQIVDQPFTAVCDWLDTCDYKCMPDLVVEPMKASDVSYDSYAIKWREAQLKERLRSLFAKQVFYKLENVWDMFSDVPKQAVSELLLNVIGNRAFIVKNSGRDGYIIYRNGYYLFQPKEIVDLSVPIALRVAKIPVRRDEYSPDMAVVAAAMGPVTKGAEEVEGAEDVEGADVGLAGPSEEELSVEDIMFVWDAWNGWINALIDNYEADVPDNISIFLYNRAKKNQKEYLRRLQRYEMVGWVAQAMAPWTDEKKITFRKVGAELFWDEELNDSDRRALIMTDREKLPDDLRVVMTGVFLSLATQAGVITIRKMFSAVDNRLEYLCSGGGISDKPAACPASIMGLLERDTGGRIDKARGLRITRDGTGELYGLVVPKRGAFIFKTNKTPAKDGARLSQGEDIGNQSMMSGHYTKMEVLGEALRVSGRDMLDMKPGVFKGERKIVNAVRAAMVIDIVLRIMDDWRVGGKKWFYRALEAVAVGHRGDAAERA